MSDEILTYARTVNVDGHELLLHRGEGGRVWVRFTLSNRFVGVLSTARALMTRIDTQPARDRELTRQLSADRVIDPPMYLAGLRSASFVVWHGNDAEGLGSELASMLSGRRLLVRFFTLDGRQVDTAFSLANARTPVLDALGLPRHSKTQRQDPSPDFAPLLASATVHCQQQGDGAPRCHELVGYCVTLHRADVVAFAKCLEEELPPR